MTRRPTLFELLDEAAPRLVRMGHEAIAECHAFGHPAWVADRETERIVRLDPDGSRHFKEPRLYSDQGLDVLRSVEPVRRPDAYAVHDIDEDVAARLDQPLEGVTSLAREPMPEGSRRISRMYLTDRDYQETLQS